jgi:hypothetical protein
VRTEFAHTGHEAGCLRIMQQDNVDLADHHLQARQVVLQDACVNVYARRHRDRPLRRGRLAARCDSQLCSFTALATVLITLAFLCRVLAHFPVAALGVLIIYAAIRLTDVAEFRRL